MPHTLVSDGKQPRVGEDRDITVEYAEGPGYSGSDIRPAWRSDAGKGPGLMVIAARGRYADEQTCELSEARTHTQQSAARWGQDQPG